MTNHSAAGQLKERLDFIELGPEQRARLRELKPIISQAIGPALSVFYDKIRKVPETRKFFSDPQLVAHAKQKQLQHWDIISSGEFNAEYERRVRAVGNTHARLGLEPRWYIGGYALVAEHLIHAVVGTMWPRLFGVAGSKAQLVGDALAVLIKATLLDMELAISIYLEALEEQRRQAEAERATAVAAQDEAVQAVTSALDRLSHGDLTTQITAELAPQFGELKANFNGSITKLRQALERVVGTTDSIHGSTQEISTSSDDLARRTEQQAANLGETAAALDEITSTVNRAAEGAKHARDVVLAATSDAQSSGDIVRRAVDAMSDIEKSSRQIGQIISVIDEIAFQTNLLALNAGVEAARAGDAGRGFAVVASEVRSLAQRSAEAAKEIKLLIQASTTQVEHGVDLVAQTGTSLQRIISQVSEINTVVADIAAGAREQATGLQEVNTAINQMDQVTQQNAAMVEEATAASHSLMQETRELVRLIEQFNLGDHGGAKSGASIGAGKPKRRPRPAASTAAAKPQIKTTGAALPAPTENTDADWEDF